MNRFWTSALLSAALVVLAPAVLQADDHKDDAHRYHDKSHKDDHEWNNNENQAYHMWAKEKHRKDEDFSRLKERDQQSYWNWRHEHSNALLKIEIH